MFSLMTFLLSVASTTNHGKTNSLRQANGASLIPKSAAAWTSLVRALSSWPDDLGSLTSWGEKDVLVIDSLNFAGKAALRHIQQLNGRLANPPSWDDYREAQRLVENLCAKLYATSVRCNVICLSHVREIGKREDVVDDKGRVRTVEVADTIKGFPETGTGRALSPTIGRYFNAVLLTDIEGTGQATRRVIRTVPQGNVGLKNSAPSKVRPKYSIETGLAEYFEAGKRRQKGRKSRRNTTTNQTRNLTHVSKLQRSSLPPSRLRKETIYKTRRNLLRNYPRLQIRCFSKTKNPLRSLHSQQPLPWGRYPSRELPDEDGNPIDFSKWTPARDFYLTDDAIYRLKDFLKSLGIPTDGRSFMETIPRPRVCL